MFWRPDLFSARGDARTVKACEVLASLLVLRYLKSWSICVNFHHAVREGYLYPLPEGHP